jgi:tRNA(fMet)-specific endonuclease VapC
MRYVLDTTACSAAMRRDPALLGILKEKRPGNFVTVPPVVAEIQYGIERLDHSSKKYLLLTAERDRLFSVIRTLPWTSESSENFGKIKAKLEREGELIDDFDIAIAAIAIAHKCNVITANLKHFRRITALESRNWK